MTTLTIGDIRPLAVVGPPEWNTETLRHRTVTGTDGYTATLARYVACYIEATVSVPATVRVTDLDKAPVRVRLDLDDGRSFQGEDMYNTAGVSTDGYTVHLRFEGASVERV